MNFPVVTSYMGDSSVVMDAIATLFFEDGFIVADVTYGKGVFWKNIDTSRFTFLPSDLFSGDVPAEDGTSLPYDDFSLDVVVIDPPYKQGSGCPMTIDGYNNNKRKKHGMEAVLGLYRDFMEEAWRVLRVDGYMVVKCQDQIESGKQTRQSIGVWRMAVEEMGMTDVDMFIQTNSRAPVMRHNYQHHARKNHSVYWVFQKR